MRYICIFNIEIYLKKYKHPNKYLYMPPLTFLPIIFLTLDGCRVPTGSGKRERNMVRETFFG